MCVNTAGVGTSAGVSMGLPLMHAQRFNTQLTHALTPARAVANSTSTPTLTRWGNMRGYQSGCGLPFSPHGSLIEQVHLAK
jgi:hypothetical protein